MKLRLIALMFAVAVMLSPATAVAQPPVGIQVRGHWTIEVRNPDGSLVSRHEFDNHLGNGGDLMAAILTRTTKPARWVVALGVGLSTGFGLPSGPCSSNATTAPWPCWIEEKAITNPLTITHSVGVQLNGTATATRAGSISEVGSRLITCPVASTIAECDAVSAGTTSWGASTFFTSTVLPQSISVQTSQIIQVKVVISFSSAPPS